MLHHDMDRISRGCQPCPHPTGPASCSLIAETFKQEFNVVCGSEIPSGIEQHLTVYVERAKWCHIIGLVGNVRCSFRKPRRGLKSPQRTPPHACYGNPSRAAAIHTPKLGQSTVVTHTYIRIHTLMQAMR